MDIDVYHCPNCDVVQGPSLSEYLGQHGSPHLTPHAFGFPPPFPGGGEERVSLQSEFFPFLPWGDGSSPVSPEANINWLIEQHFRALHSLCLLQ